MSMTSRERMLAAMAGGVPDRMPASPDTNWMIPARLVGGPFWNVYHYGQPPIWKAYNDCVLRFGIDGFSHHGTYSMPPLPGVEHSSEMAEQTEEHLVIRSRMRCPHGELTSETIFLRGDPPTPILKPVTDFAGQFECVRSLLFGNVGKISFDQYRDSWHSNETTRKSFASLPIRCTRAQIP